MWLSGSMSLLLPTTMKSRIYLSAPVADEFRKLCKLVHSDPDKMLTVLMNDYLKKHAGLTSLETKTKRR
jgi:hypothetical protein